MRLAAKGGQNQAQKILEIVGSDKVNQRLEKSVLAPFYRLAKIMGIPKALVLSAACFGVMQALKSLRNGGDTPTINRVTSLVRTYLHRFLPVGLLSLSWMGRVRLHHLVREERWDARMFARALASARLLAALPSSVYAYAPRRSDEGSGRVDLVLWDERKSCGYVVVLESRGEPHLGEEQALLCGHPVGSSIVPLTGYEALEDRKVREAHLWFARFIAGRSGKWSRLMATIRSDRSPGIIEQCEDVRHAVWTLFPGRPPALERMAG